MAKKNLTSVLGGIIGSNPEEQPIVEAQAPEITEEMEENLEVRRRQNVGRPRKMSSIERKTSNDTRATFIVDAELLRKLKYISLAESLLLKEALNTALTNYVEAWEAENGKIRLPGLKNSKPHENIRGAEYYRQALEERKDSDK